MAEIPSEIILNNGEIIEFVKDGRKVEALDSIVNGYVYPGFIDAHCHFLAYGLQQGMVDVSSANSFQETIDILQKNIDKQNKNWLIGYGWDQNQWKDKEEEKKW